MKRDARRAFISFYNEFSKFRNAGAGMLDSI